MKLGTRSGCGVTFTWYKKVLRFRIILKHQLLQGKDSRPEYFEIHLKTKFKQPIVKKRTVEVATAIVLYILNQSSKESSDGR